MSERSAVHCWKGCKKGAFQLLPHGVGIDVDHQSFELFTPLSCNSSFAQTQKMLQCPSDAGSCIRHSLESALGVVSDTMAIVLILSFPVVNMIRYRLGEEVLPAIWLESCRLIKSPPGHAMKLRRPWQK